MSPQTLKSPKPVRILLAEDNLADAHMALEVFKECKVAAEITRVKDGEEAVHNLKKAGPYRGKPLPDLILLDLNMPRMGGLEVLQEIKNDPKLREIPVLILTSSLADFDKRKSYEFKANFYMVKPAEVKGFFELAKYVEEIWFKGLPAPVE
jgi:CheY-like chemotaxis protein